MASGSNCAVKPTRLRRAAYFRSLVPSYSALCRTAFIPALRLSQRFLFGGFGALLGFACVCLVGFKPFGPLALVQQAPPAILLAALRRFRGPAVFLGLRPSSRQGVPFWPSGLTLRSSGPAFCGPLTLAVSLSRIRLPTSRPMVALPAVIHSQVLPLVFGRSAGLRLLAGSVFKAFLAVTVRPHSASSSVFHSIRRLAGVVFHPAANPAVKLTRQRRAAYFVR